MRTPRASDEIRQAAIVGLGPLGIKAESAVSLLARELKDKNMDLRGAAATALGRMGPKVHEAWPAIKEAYGDGDNGVRNQVIRLAGSLAKDQKEAITLLVAAAQKR